MCLIGRIAGPLRSPLHLCELHEKRRLVQDGNLQASGLAVLRAGLFAKHNPVGFASPLHNRRLQGENRWQRGEDRMPGFAFIC